MLSADSLESLGESVAGLGDVFGIGSKISIVGISESIFDSLSIYDRLLAIKAVKLVVPAIDVAACQRGNSSADKN